MSLTDIRDADQDVGLRDRVREVLAATFLVEASELPDDVCQETCDRWTSLYHMMLLTVLEDEFNLCFSVDEMTTMTSLPKILDALNAHGVRA